MKCTDDPECKSCHDRRRQLASIAQDVTAVAGKYSSGVRHMLESYRAACIELGSSIERARNGRDLEAHRNSVSSLLRLEEELLSKVERIPLDAWRYFQNLGVEMNTSALSEDDRRRAIREGLI